MVIVTNTADLASVNPAFLISCYGDAINEVEANTLQNQIQTASCRFWP